MGEEKRRREEQEKRIREKEEKRIREKEEENPSLECLKLMFGIHVWNSCLELMFGIHVWICWLGNYPNSSFAYFWVRKTLTLQCMYILVGSSQFCGWL